MRPKQLFAFICALAISTSLFAQEEEDKTISPYFFVSCPDSTTDRLPLKHTAADVTVRQTYCNEGENVLYEEAKEEGKTASPLEQDRSNVFKMNVANILPSDTIQIEMKYTELLVPTGGEYEFVYPTVVGPRFVSHGEDSASTAFAGTPFTLEGVPQGQRI